MSEVAAGCLGHSLPSVNMAEPAAATLRVLSIEDDASLRQFVETVLQANSYAVSTAPDGKAGLAQAIESPPDLILLDLIMPYKNGFEVLRALRQDDRTRAVPVIVLSSQG